MTCNSWQTNKTKVLWKRCLPRADPKNFEQRGEVFAVGVWGIQLWSGFSQISKNKRVENSLATSNFKQIFLLHRTDLLCKALEPPTFFLLGFWSNLIVVDNFWIVFCWLCKELSPWPWPWPWPWRVSRCGVVSQNWQKYTQVVILGTFRGHVL